MEIEIPNEYLINNYDYEFEKEKYEDMISTIEHIINEDIEKLNSDINLLMMIKKNSKIHLNNIEIAQRIKLNMKLQYSDLIIR